MDIVETILRESSDSNISLSDILRKCKILSNILKIGVLESWVDNELNGYDESAEVPQYRRLRIIAEGKFSLFTHTIRKQIPQNTLDEKYRHWASRAVVRQSVDSISNLVILENENLAILWPPDLIAYLQDKPIIDGWILDSAWQSISKGQLLDILSSVRTKVLDFVLALKEEIPELEKFDLSSTTNQEQQLKATHVITNLFGSMKDKTEKNNLHNTNEKVKDGENPQDEQLPEIIQDFGHPDEMQKTLAFRFPSKGIALFNLGSIIRVRNNQNAIIYHDGEALDVFLPGSHVLSIENLPLLIKKTGEDILRRSPFPLEIYFLSTREYLGNWGTPQPFIGGNRNSDMALIQGYGNYSYYVSNPQVFINYIGGVRMYSLENAESRFRFLIVGALTQAIGKLNQKDGISAFEIINRPKVMEQKVQSILKKEFLEIGITFIRLAIVGWRICDDSVSQINAMVSYKKPSDEITNDTTDDVSDVNKFSLNNEVIIMGDKYLTGQAGTVGPNGHAHDIRFFQNWEKNMKDFDLNVLASELNTLRTKLKQNAETQDQDIAIGEIASAEIASKKEDWPKVIGHLAKAGKWAFETATNIGVRIAAEAIKTSMNLPPNS